MKIRDFDDGLGVGASDYPVSADDERIGNALAYVIGKIDDIDGDWTSADEWSAVVRSLRIHGFTIVPETDPTKLARLPTSRKIDVPVEETKRNSPHRRPYWYLDGSDGLCPRITDLPAGG